MREPTLLDLRGSGLGRAALGPAAAHLARGGIVAYPTETVYGFGGPCTPAGVARIQRLKRRSGEQPLLILLRGPEDAVGLRWPDEARTLASVFWPGPLTLVLSDPDRIFPDGVRSKEGTVAVRVSPHPLVAALLEFVATPLTSTSANVPGGPPALTAQDALDAAMRLGAGEEMLVLDGGSLPPSGPSTIVDCSGDVPVVVREGSVSASRLRSALPEVHGH